MKLDGAYIYFQELTSEEYLLSNMLHLLKYCIDMNRIHFYLLIASFSFYTNQEASPWEPGPAVWRVHQTKTHLYRDRVPFQRLFADIPQGGAKAASNGCPAAGDV